MGPFTRILCPVDGSAISRRALHYAIGLARSFAARLEVLEVVPTGLTSAQRRAASDELGRFSEPARAAGIPVDLTLGVGMVAPEVLRAAADAGTDLIVMGTHGRTGFERFLLGSVAERVLRKARCPVLAVPPGHAPGPDLAFHSVVCGVDFAPGSVRAIDYAQMLTAPGGRLLLVHAVGWPFGERTEAMPPEIDALRKSLENEALGRLQRAAAAGRRPDIFLGETVATGKPYAVVLHHARQASADLIAVGLHSHATNELALLGSTTRHILHDAPCPVLTVSDG